LKRFGNEEVDAVREVIENGKYLSGFTTHFRGGEQVQKFEEEFAKYLGVKHAISVNSGTSALLIAFLTAKQFGKKQSNLKLQNPDIHIPATTFTADPSAALLAGGKVVFEDIDPQTYCMLSPKNNPTISVPTYLLGNAMEKPDFGNSDFIIEDCCQALGTTIDDKKVGNFGDLSVWSFQETKHITTLGEGGMVCSNNEELIEIVAGIRNHAEFYSNQNYLGGNFRMTEVQAAFGRVQLKKINTILKLFRENAEYVIKNLPDGIIPPYVPSNVNHSYLMIGCLYDERKINTSRKKFLDKLTINRQNILKNDEKSDIKGINMKSGKLISAGYNMPLYEVPRYNSFKPDGGCPNAEEFVTKSLWMDIHKFRTKDEIDIEIEIINSTIKEFQ
jgi:perosamine synthetase